MISKTGRFCVIGRGLLVRLAFLPEQPFAQVNYDSARRERHLQAVKSSSPIVVIGANYPDAADTSAPRGRMRQKSTTRSRASMARYISAQNAT